MHMIVGQFSAHRPLLDLQGRCYRTGRDMFAEGSSGHV